MAISIGSGVAGRQFVCVRVFFLLPVLFLTSQLLFAGGVETGVVTTSPRGHGLTTSPASALTDNRQLGSSLAALERLQSELGRYDPALAEAHGELAGIYHRQGHFRPAATHYREAFQLTRINSGLYSETQLPYVADLIENQLLAGDWQEADAMFQLQFSIKTRLFQPSDARFAEAVAELGDWKVRALRDNLLDEGYRELALEAQALDDFYRDAIDRVSQIQGDYAPALLPLYQGKSHADLAIARVLANTPYQFFAGTVNPYTTQTVCQNTGAGRDGVSRQCTSVQRDNPLYPESQRKSKHATVFRHVRELENTLESLNRILLHNPDGVSDRRDSLDSDMLKLKSEFAEFKSVDLAACCANNSPLASRSH